MNQEDQIQFVLDLTARAAKIVIDMIRTGELRGLECDTEKLRRLVTWAMNPARKGENNENRRI